MTDFFCCLPIIGEIPDTKTDKTNKKENYCEGGLQTRSCCFNISQK